ncbi:2-oxoacid:acceptor oxidoreductase family protein [Fusibacter sp. JL216-2]|uniref:2-oxoacid:acceptor oxidoreductase family protein n=1 Tax=Fusibacter sp. JL216-2 TaxID=3071453 RepID=UPI003D333BF3
MNHVEMRLSGSGGQGLILAGIILAEAALLDGKNAIQSQSYGPEARGGASKAEVIISDADIDFPKVQSPDLILALTQVASDKYIEEIKEEGMVVVDESIILPEGLKAKKIVQVPIMQTAAEKVGKSIVANIVALGLIAGLTNCASKESVEKAVLSRVPKGTEDLNKSALEEGYRLAAAQ